LHDLSQPNILLPPSVSNRFNNSLNEQNIDLIDDSNGEENDNISNDTIQIHLNRGSHQNLVEIQNDNSIRSPTETNGTQTDNLNNERTLYQSVISCVRMPSILLIEVE